MALHKSFFSDPTVSQILGELMEIRRGCQSWLGVTEAHYHDGTGKAVPMSSVPEWLVPVFDPKRGTLNCFRDSINFSSLYEAAWTYIDGKLKVAVYSTADLCRGNPVDHSLLERYLPKLQGYGGPVEIFPFRRDVIMEGKVLFEKKQTWGTRTDAVCIEEAKDSIPKAWYDRDFKAIIQYSQELVDI